MTNLTGLEMKAIEATEEVGREVVAAAARAGLATVWDGSAGQRVKVLLPGGIDAPAEEAAR